MRISDEHRELLAAIRPVGMPETPCHECVPAVDGLEITHTEDCPVSIDVDAACNGDREWFDKHPAADFFFREISWGEASQLITMRADLYAALPPDSKISAVGKVRVERVGEGIRIRRFEDVYFVVED